MHFIIQMRAATVLNSREGELLCLTKRFLKREWINHGNAFSRSFVSLLFLSVERAGNASRKIHPIPLPYVAIVFSVSLLRLD
jgi:hypothetical protein